MTNDKVSLVPQLHHLLSEGKLGRIQVPITVVCPEQALDDACWGSLPVVVGECGSVRQLYFSCKESCENRKRFSYLNVAAWDRRGHSS